MSDVIKPMDLIISPCELRDIRRFVEDRHYSHNVNGVKITQCFSVTYNATIIGGVIYGALSTTAWKKFTDNEREVIELRRLVLDDSAGKTSESHVIGRTLRWIRVNLPNVTKVVSYADPMYGHTGTIYKASNFTFVGMSANDVGYKDPTTGKIYHSRALRTKYKGEYKPFVKRLRMLYDEGKLEKVELRGKYCYVYIVNKKSRRSGVCV